MTFLAKTIKQDLDGFKFHKVYFNKSLIEILESDN